MDRPKYWSRWKNVHTNLKKIFFWQKYLKKASKDLKVKTKNLINNCLVIGAWKSKCVSSFSLFSKSRTFLTSNFYYNSLLTKIVKIFYLLIIEIENYLKLQKLFIISWFPHLNIQGLLYRQLKMKKRQKWHFATFQNSFIPRK